MPTCTPCPASPPRQVVKAPVAWLASVMTPRALSLGGRLPRQMHEEREVAGTVSDEEDLGTASVLPYCVDRRRDVVQPECLEVGPVPVALAGSMTPELEDPAVEAFLREIRREPAAEAAVGEGPVRQDHRGEARHVRRVARQRDRDPVFGPGGMDRGRHGSMSPSRLRDGRLRS